MSVTTEIKKKQAVLRTVMYGAVSAALLAAVFSHADAMTSLFSLGGIYAALPIGMVFAFSFAHGAFASNLWSALGIEATTKKTAPRSAESVPRPAQRPRARLRMSA
jgi:hypothetical protein